VGEFVTVARVDDVPAGTLRKIELDGEEIALAHVNGRFCATQGACLHLGGPLGEGQLEGSVVTCPWHGWQYDVCTGLNEFDHAIRLQTYEVRVEGDEVQVRRG
jgi:nitrite reductase (NADH) small subunit